MAGMPKKQEHFSANAMDGGYPEKAGAFFGKRHGTWCELQTVRPGFRRGRL